MHWPSEAGKNELDRGTLNARYEARRASTAELDIPGYESQIAHPRAHYYELHIKTFADVVSSIFGGVEGYLRNAQRGDSNSDGPPVRCRSNENP